MLNSKSIRRLARSSVIEFGVHTHSHYILGKLGKDEQRSEILTSKRIVETLTSKPCVSFAYPNGQPQDYNADTLAILDQCGIEIAVTTVSSPSGPASKPLELPRVAVDGRSSLSQFKLSLFNILGRFRRQTSNMVIVTCANSVIAKDHGGNLRDTIKFRFTKVISTTATNAERFGYGVDIYDLGELGMGAPFIVDDPNFVKMGHYEREPVSGYKSKSLFKPALMKHCLAKHQRLTVYLDGDAELRRRMDEVVTNDYDVGVTLRDQSEMETDWYKSNKDVVRFLNAGVIFFNYTDATFEFIDRWEELTDQVGNDQMALNKLACPEDYPEPGSIRVIDGVRIKYFPCVQYNYYYFFDKLPWKAKIMHYKGDVRHLYPFGGLKYALSMMYVPLKSLGRLVLRRRK